MAALLVLPTAPPLRTRQAAAGGAACALRCSTVACMRAQALATPRSARVKPATAAGRCSRFLVSASDVRSRFATGGASHGTKRQRSRNTCTALQRQVEDWEPLETPRSPPARLPQPLPPLPPPPPLARSGMSDTVKAAAAAAAVLLLFAAREFTSDSTRLWSQLMPVRDGEAVDIARFRKDGSMMVIDSARYGQLAFEQDSQGNILFADEDGDLYLTVEKLGTPVMYRIGRVDDLTPETLRSTLAAIRVLGAAPTEEAIEQVLAQRLGLVGRK